MFLRKSKEGDWYICKRTLGANRQGSWGKKAYKDRFLIKWSGNGMCGQLYVGERIDFPKELVGRRIRLKVEVIK